MALNLLAATDDDLAPVERPVPATVHESAGTTNSQFWQRFFAGAEVYAGWRILGDEQGRWWSWDGWSIGTSACEADCRRAAVLFPGKLHKGGHDRG